MYLSYQSRSLLVLMIFCYGNIFGQLKKPVLSDSLFSTYYHQRVSHFKTLPLKPGQIVFLGNSITDGAEWSELFDDIRVINRGISGDVSSGIMNRVEEVVQRKPGKIFLLIGTNDLAKRITIDSLVKNILWLADYFKQESPSTRIFIQSILPVNDFFGKFPQHTANGEKIRMVNQKLTKAATQHNFQFIDLDPFFADATGKLSPELSNDGLHLNGAGYSLWKHHLFPYIYELQTKASIIPLPRKIEWRNSSFPISECTTLVVRDSVLLKEAEYLRQKFNVKGIMLRLSNKVPGNSGSPYIELKLGLVEVPQFKEEAYRLQVDDDKVLLTANTAHGIFNGIQTFLQLDRDGVLVDNCEILDWPAFAWRGYMVDAGRNFQSMDLLKQQIDIMSRYKLNIFHFHLTEDIAWRLYIKQYPQLVAADNMLRNKGKYYSEADLKDLIAYCKERYITLIPEIDMPGHSAAFTRAFNTGMQTDSGLNIVKNLLKEILQTYDVPYLHIGADEVKITNKHFVPEVTRFIESFGRKVIGWEPGGNFNEGTIRQLWMDDGGKLSESHSIRYLDSRHLYLNHMDPLESVVTIFNRKIGGKEQGDSQALGAILCVWPDRRVEREEDALRMNAVYPGMISFAERCWKGGGQDGLTATIGDAKSKGAVSFTEFENRLLDHQTSFFQLLPFPYRKQSTTIWKLYGPYDNKGNMDASFEPEEKGFDENKEKSFEAVGGTIILRHWWYPKIKGVVKDPKENTTWYAISSIWSEEDKMQDFWIGFNNLSRSYNTDSPAKGTWDKPGSKIWINGERIDPPIWKQAGQKGHAEVPLIDEGYEYRTPTSVPVKKGWNTILIKLPVGSFEGKDWQNPVKWMFTCVAV